MTRRIAITLALFVWSLLVFAAGYAYRASAFHAARFVTSKALVLEAPTGGAEGLLPAGTIVHWYGGPDEQPLFVVFVGTKELTQLRAHPSKHWLEISPLAAYSRAP